MTAITAQASRNITGTRRRVAAGSGEVETGEVTGGAQSVGSRVGGDPAEGQHIGAVRELEGERRLLLDEENGEAAAVELPQRLQDLPPHAWGGTNRRLLPHPQCGLRHHPPPPPPPLP